MVASRFLVTIGLVGLTVAHMTLNDPCPRFSPFCQQKPPLPPSITDYDYSITNPIQRSGNLCKSSTPWPQPVAKWTAGQQISVTFYAGSTHGGGHCQFSLSYDGGKTFVVIYQVLEHCFMNRSAESKGLGYTFTLPKDVPGSDKAVFAWSWVNAIGDREFYMNCADVSIQGSGSSYTGKELTIVNHEGYPTIPEFQGNSSTGLEVYHAAKAITVTANGKADVARALDTAPILPDNADECSEPDQATPPDEGSNDQTSAENTEDECSEDSTPVGNPEDACTESESAAADPPTAASTAPEPSAVYSAETPATETKDNGSPASKVAQTKDDSGCSGQSMRCAANGGYQICANGAWSDDLPCGPGTKCVDGDEAVYCGWPNE